MVEKTTATTTTATIPSAATAKPSLFGNGSDWWNGVLILALAIAAIGAIATVVTTQIVISLQRREAIAAANNFSAYKVQAAAQVAEARQEGLKAGSAAADADARAAEANAQAAEARKGAADANERAANANARAASLEKEAAAAKLEQERLKASVAWRTLSLQTATTLEQNLSARPGSVTLWYVVGDPESLFLAIQFSRIFEAAHWKVAAAGANLSGIVFGVSLTQADSPDGIVLGNALRAAGVDFSTNPIPPMAFTSGATQLKDAPILMIGSKRPPEFP